MKRNIYVFRQIKRKMNPLKNAKFGGWIVSVTFLVIAIRAGIGMQTLGFIIRPMADEMGWQSSVITLCITLQLVVAAVIGPRIGRLLDAVGAKKILTAGLVANGVMLILVSFVGELWQLAVVMILFGGITQACIGNSLIMPLITKWFVARRGFVMGFVSTGANLGSVLLAPLIVRLMGAHADWRFAWFVIGLIPIVLIAPIVYLVLDRGENIPPPAHEDPGTSSTPRETTFTVGQALRNPVFWKLIVAWNLVDFAMKGALLNKIPYALEMGFSEADAAGIIALYGILAIAGKLLTGWISDRVPLHVVGVAMSILQAAGMYLFIDAPGTLTLYLSYGVLSGLSAGGLIALTPIMLANYYGSKFQGALSGITISLLLFSSVGGPVSASVIRDLSGSYRNGFLLYTALTLVAVILFALIRKPKPIIR